MSNIKNNNTMTQIKFTQVGKTYFEEEGAYQEEYNRLWNELVPSRGAAQTINGELIRTIGRLTHDFFNNGNCNVVEIERVDCDECGGNGWEIVDLLDGEQEEQDCEWCGGHCQVDGEVVIRPHYKEMLDFLREFVEEEQEVKQLEKFILWAAPHEGDMLIYDEAKCHIYTELTDSIIYQVLTSNTDEPNPYYVKP
jgi:hypothetical protein